MMGHKSLKLETGKTLRARETPVPGLKVFDLPVHGDHRGWFKENWQRQKMVALGLEDFGPVQNNISFNAAPGVTRGIHAEPWDKFISVSTGRVFGAWVDLRQGSSFGTTFWCEIDPSVAVFVPRGVGNAFQALEEYTAYTYLVNDHWSAKAQDEYTFLNLADETVSIPWPIPLEDGELSEHDHVHPRLADVTPMQPKMTLVIGSTGQLSRALSELWADRDDVFFVGRETVDLGRPETLDAVNWATVGTVVNAAAYTAVDEAETSAGREVAWAVNAAGPARLARIAAEYRLRLVHISTDYVFDGSRRVHDEQEPFAPLGVYGQSKAAADHAVASSPKSYILRTSWVIGEGDNFVRTMAALAEQGVDPSVVDDQVGRLSFVHTIANAIDHLLAGEAEYGTYNVSNSGEAVAWAEVARRVFEYLGHDAGRITPVTTAEYFAGRDDVASRPASSTFDLTKLASTGFHPENQFAALQKYLKTK